MLIRIVVALMSLFMAAQAHAAARTQLDQFSQGLDSLKGSFEQRSNAGGKTERSGGTLALKVPRLLRWDYLEPFEQRIVADGNHVWIHDIDLEQVSVRPQSFDEASSPLAVLMDLGQLDQEFKVSEGGRAEGMDWLLLLPKSKEPQFTEVRLGFAEGELRAMRVIDSFDGRTDYAFSNWSRNTPLAADYFVFVPSEGVDVIGDQRDAAQIQPLQD